MDASEYQVFAARTISCKTKSDMTAHALHGMSGEIGELHSIYQKVYQGHSFDISHAIKEVGDLLWFIAEWCSAYGLDLSDVMELNIEKLKARYPDGFSADRSLHRAEGDI